MDIPSFTLKLPVIPNAEQRSYVIGRDAVYFKHCSQGDKLMMRVAYWEILGLLKSLGKNALSVHSVVPQLRDLRYLITGAVLAARWRFAWAKQRDRQDQP